MLGLISIALKMMGVAADTFDVIEGIEWLIQREKNCNAQDLFRRSFGHAVKQCACKLGHFAENHDAALIAVDQLNLDRAMAGIGTTDATALSREPREIACELAPLFRACIIIPNHRLADNEFDRETSTVLELAFQHFISDLPAHPLAFRAVELGHILGSAREHDQQQQVLERILATLNEIQAHQATLLRDRPELSATMVQLESVRPEFRNPFRIVTAESFDHDYRLLAQLFMQPSDYDNIRSHDNLLLAGGRGCGKSMILKSMAAIAAVEIQRLRHASENPAPAHLSFAESGVDYFGVYIKLFRGYFSEYTPDTKFSEEAAHVYFQHYLNCLLLRSLLDALKEAETHNLIRFQPHVERQIVEEIASIAGWSVAELNIVGLIRHLRLEENRVGHYVTKLRLSERAPEYDGNYTTIDIFLRDCCAVITSAVPDLKGRRIYFLLDEFENLAEFQQKVVNTLAKLRPVSLSLKIATRSGGLKCNENLQGEAMQFPRDYQLVSLDYDARGADYSALLLEIGRRRLKAEGFAVDDLTRLLESAPRFHPASEKEIEQAMAGLLIEISKGGEPVSAEKEKEKRHQWGDAYVFRVNENRQKPWTYAGFPAFTQLSSGIISNFMELCKMAFYMADWEGIDVRGGQPIPWRIQNEAVYKTSQAAFDWVPKNIAETGPTISRLLSDIGDVIRAKLLGHTSEPEAARIAIKDPEALESVKCQTLTRILEDAVRWSVLQTPGLAKAYLPKHREDVRPRNYYPNRILVPHLRISANFRWTTDFATADLLALIDEKTRVAKRNGLIKRHGRNRLMVDKQLGNAGPSDPELFQE